MSDGDIANLTSAEVQCTGVELEKRANGLPVLFEHDAGKKVGHVLTSWEGREGELRVVGVVTDPVVERSMRAGKNQGLSLGTDVVHDTAGSALYKSQQEISVCAEPRRHGCYVDHIDGKRVRTSKRFSKGARRPLQPRRPGCAPPAPAAPASPAALSRPR